jgi:hypothetical protein
LRISIDFKAISFPSIDANDFDVLAHPIQRQVDPAAVSRRFDFLFDHFFPEDSELRLGGLAGIFRFPADLFEARLSSQGDHILLELAEHVNFLSARSLRNSRLAPAEFPMGESYSVKLLHLFIILLIIRDIPEVGCGTFPAINWLQFSYKVVIGGSPEPVKEKFNSYNLITI